jgi:hypothetical protein
MPMTAGHFAYIRHTSTSYERIVSPPKVMKPSNPFVNGQINKKCISWIYLILEFDPLERCVNEQRVMFWSFASSKLALANDSLIQI